MTERIYELRDEAGRLVAVVTFRSALPVEDRTHIELNGVMYQASEITAKQKQERYYSNG